MGCGPKCDSPGEASFDRESMSPIEDRKCRDVLWLIVYFICCIGSIALTARGIAEGDLDNLKFGISSNSTLCGHGDEAEFPKLVYCLNATSVTNPTNFDFVFKVCARKCPESREELEEFFNEKSDEFVSATGIGVDTWQANDDLLLRASCVAPSISVLNRCVLDVTVNASRLELLYDFASDPGNEFLATGAQMFINAYGDIATTWYVIIICGVVGGLVFSFIWLQLLRCLAGPLVWTTIVIFFCTLIMADYLLGVKSGYVSNNLDDDAPLGLGGVENDEPDVESEYEDYYKYLFWFFVAGTFILFCVFVFMLNRIRLAIALIKETAHVFKAIPAILFLPIINMVVVGTFFGYAMISGAFLASAGEIRDGELKWDRDLRTALVYHVFFSLWTCFFLLGLHSVIMAGTVASYYWAKDKKKMSFPIPGAISRTLMYHMGSVAIGSFVLATVKMVKWYLMWLSNKVEKYGSKDNKAIKFVMCCFRCCLHCLEKFIQFVTKNAYIMIAVDGHSFCYATGQAWQLIASNAARMTAVNLVSAYVFFIAKVGVGFFAGLFTTLWIEEKFQYEDGRSDVSSAFAPSLCAFILGYFIAHLFYEVADFTIDTLLLCFCLDDIRNRESGDYFASTRLIKFMVRAPKIKAKEVE